MLRFSTIVACVLMSLGTHQAQPTPTADEMLAKAMGKIELCSSKTIITDLSSGKVVKPSLDDTKTAKKVDPRAVFKQGRFQLTKLEGEYSVDGRVSIKLLFAPWPSEKQLDPQDGEDEKIERAMNHLTGWIAIDKLTGEIVRAEANLSEKIRYKGGLGALYELSFEVSQTFERGYGSLYEAELTHNFRRLFKTNHKHYKTRFDCQ